MKSFFRFFAERHLIANLFTIIMLLMGVSTLFTIKRDIFPNVDLGKMVISTEYPGASPEDVELNVTNKIEDELKNITGIKQITSVSAENISSIEIDIEADAEDPGETKDEIRRAVNRTTGFPPEVTDSPHVLDIKTPFDPFIEVGVTGDIPYRKLREIARILEKKLENTNGVSRVGRFGYQDREIKIEVSPAAMNKYQIPMREIISAIQGRNIRGTGGSLESYTSEKNVVTLSQFKNPKEVEEVIIRSTFEGQTVKVKDLAKVYDSFEEERVISRMNGEKAISFVLFNKASADVIRTAKKVKELIKREQKNMPDGVSIIYSNDTSQYVESTFKIVVSNGAIGLCLVVILLTIFLNVRTAFWVAVGIPVTFLGAIFLLPSFGAYLDTIVLTAMIIVIGIVVDDAIIVSESIYMRREQGESPVEAGINGVNSVFRPVVTTVLTTFIAFAPMFFMPGMMGKFVYVIPLTVSLALFISLLEVTIALPSHLVYSLEKQALSGKPIKSGQWFKPIRNLFGKFIHYPLRARYLMILIFFAIFAGTMLYAVKHMSFILFPTTGAEKFFVVVELPTGTSLNATADEVKKVEEIILNLPDGELDSFVTRVGVSLVIGGSPRNGENYVTMIVNLTPWSKRTRTADEIVEDIREKANAIKTIKKVTFSIDGGGPPAGKAVTIRVVGSDDAMRKKLAMDVKKHLSGIDGVKDIELDDALGKQQISINIDYEKLARVGLTVADIARNVRIAYDGQVVTSVRYGDEDVAFRVILEKSARKKLSYLKELTIPNNKGRLIALKDVATLDEQSGPNDVHHFDRERTTTVTADVLQGVTTSLEVTNNALKNFNLDKDYPSMRFMVGGEAQETEESMQGLYVAFVLAVVGIYFLLILLFNSIIQPLMVLLAIPFGLVGVVLAFTLHGESFGFLALLGVVGMSGVVVNDSLVLVNHINQLRRKNPSANIRDIVARGTSDRLRAVIMTTCTTVGGLLPLAYGIGGSDLYMGPMALALGYGILFATPLTLVLIPCLYLVGTDFKSLFQKKEIVSS